MQKQRIEKILAWIIRICLYLIVFAPLLMDADYFFPAIFPKTVHVRVLAEIAAVAFIGLVILEPKYRPGLNIIYISLAIFAVIVFITSITGINFSYSFWGNYERMDGIFTWLHLWALIIIVASVLKTKNDWHALFGFSIFAAVLMSGYGFLQRAGVGHIGPWQIYETNLGRITGTIGNPAFLGVYLLFNLTFALIIATSANTKLWQRIMAGLALVPIFTAYMMTGVRGAFIGFVAGVVFFFIGYMLWSRENRRVRNIVLAGFAGFLIMLGALYMLKDNNEFVRQNFGRLFSIPLSEETAQTRLISWGFECKDGLGTCGAIKGFKENFWLGVGPQKFDYVFNQYFDPRFYELVGNETWWDRAHNMVFEVAVTMGIFGLLSYLSVGLALIWAMYRIGRQNPDARLEALIIVAFLIGYFIQNLFVFDSTSVYIMLVLLIGYVIARFHMFRLEPDRIERLVRDKCGAIWKHIPSIPSIPPKYWIAGILASMAILAPIGYTYNIKLARHNKLFLYTIAYANVWDHEKIMDNYREIFRMSDFDSREVSIKISQYMGDYILRNQMPENELKNDYAFLIAEVDKAVARNPQDVRLLISYGNSLNAYAETMKQYDPQEALRVLRKSENILKEAANLGKTRQQVFHSLANVYLIAGNFDKGIETLVQTTKIEQDNPKTFWILAIAYIQAGQNQNAIRTIEQALDKNYIFSSEKEASYASAMLAENQEFELLLRLYEQAAKNINTAASKAKVAATLAQLGRKEEAISAAQEVIQMDPKLKDQVEIFIQQVKTGSRTDFLNN